ncbi:hypothetical protein GCM10010272_30870 [Streptomyces lateritius]|nr:hypothetical protein GCM10010272_30870 [Streptomyces lateritius]
MRRARGGAATSLREAAKGCGHGRGPALPWRKGRTAAWRGELLDAVRLPRDDRIRIRLTRFAVFPAAGNG